MTSIRSASFFLLAMSFLLPVTYLSCVRCISQFIVPTDASSLWKTERLQTTPVSRALLGTLIALDPINAEYHHLLAEQIYADDPDRGSRLNKKAISLSVLNSSYQIQSGWMAAQKGLTDDAFESFEKAIYVDPGNIDAYVQQGLFLISQALSCVKTEMKIFYLTMAEQSISLAIKYDRSLTHDPLIAFALASIADEKGDQDSARAILKQSKHAMIPDLTFLVQKWALHFRLGDPKTPISQWTAMLSGGKLQNGQIAALTKEMMKQNVPDFGYFLAQISLWRGHTILALERMTSLVSKRPLVTEYRLALGDILEKLGKPVEALSQYEKALALSPSNQYAKLKMIECYKTKRKRIE